MYFFVCVKTSKQQFSPPAAMKNRYTRLVFRQRQQTLTRFPNTLEK